MTRGAAVCLLLFGCGGGGGGTGDPCAGIDCSGHGDCASSGGAARCECEAGYEARGLTCEPAGGDSDSDTDVDSDVDTDSDVDCSNPDVDGDLHDAIACGGDDCDDTDDATHPGVPEDDAWTEVDIPGSGDGGVTVCAIALSIDGFPDLVWVDANAFEIRYAAYRADDWSVETIDTVIAGAVEVFADGETLHVAYQASNLLRWATRGASWEPEDVALGVFDGPISLVVVSGIPHVAFGERNVGLFHASRAGSWVVEPINDVRDAARSVSLTFDPSRDLWVSYGNAGALEIANDTSGAWLSEVVDGAHVGEDTELVFDPDSGQHLVFRDSEAQELRHVFRETRDDDFVMDVIDEDDEAGTETEVGFDTGGHLMVAYQLGGVRFATSSLGAWSLETVDDSVSGGRSLSMAVGTERIHVVHTDGASVVHYHFRAMPDGVDRDCDGID